MSTSHLAAPSHAFDALASQGASTSDIDHLGALAMLLGMQPARVDQCRVLEIGCGSGGNLMPMAERLPRSAFLGIDSAEKLIAAAGRSAVALGLDNVHFQHVDLMNVDESLGSFDYIIAPRVFSWVEPRERTRLLELCKRLLAPDGVACVGYNTHPGWAIPGVIRDMVRDSTRDDDPLGHRVEEARKLLEFFSIALDGDDSPYGRLLKSDIDRTLSGSPIDFIRDYLGPENSPIFFGEFIELAATHGLQYLGDSLFDTMFPRNLGPETHRQVLSLPGDRIEIEQHIDLLENRDARMSLLCHSEVNLRPPFVSESMQTLFFAGAIREEIPGADLSRRRSGQPDVLERWRSVRFVTGAGPTLTVTLPVVKAALIELGAAWPASRSVEQLAAAVAQRITPGEPALPAADRELLERNLVELLMAGFIDAYSQADAFVLDLARVRASRAARMQALHSQSVTNLRHEEVELDEISQKLLTILDGQRDRASLKGALNQAVEGGQLSILINGMPARGAELSSTILEQALDRSLATLAASRLLEA